MLPGVARKIRYRFLLMISRIPGPPKCPEYRTRFCLCTLCFGILGHHSGYFGGTGILELRTLGRGLSLRMAKISCPLVRSSQSGLKHMAIPFHSREGIPPYNPKEMKETKLRDS